MPALNTARLRQLVPYVLAGGTGIFLYYTATQIEFQHRAGVLGPDYWPKLILGMLIAVCLCEIVRIALAKNSESTDTSQEIGTDDEAGPLTATQAPGQIWRLLAGMAATLAYVALVATTGFFLTTAVYIAAFLVIGGYKKRKVIAAMSIGGALLLMFIFMKLVYVSLPIGSGPFSQLTILLMKLMGIR